MMEKMFQHIKKLEKFSKKIHMKKMHFQSQKNEKNT